MCKSVYTEKESGNTPTQELMCLVYSSKVNRFENNIQRQLGICIFAFVIYCRALSIDILISVGVGQLLMFYLVAARSS